MPANHIPLWMKTARAQLGVRETPGPKNSPVIMGWLRQLGAKVLGINVADDATPWCGSFAAYCVASAGLKPPPIAVRASAWATWQGPLAEPCYGAVLVFQRPGGGHVGFYTAEDETAYHVLGGNQSDAVTITRIAKDRCIAIRWPHEYPKPGGRIKVDAKGKPLSVNEA